MVSSRRDLDPRGLAAHPHRPAPTPRAPCGRGGRPPARSEVRRRRRCGSTCDRRGALRAPSSNARRSCAPASAARSSGKRSSGGAAPSLGAGEALRAARRRGTLRSLRSLGPLRVRRERRGRGKMKLGFLGEAADAAFIRRGAIRGPSDLIGRLARAAAERAGGRPAGAALSRPRPRFLGLEPGKRGGAVSWAGPKTAWARK